MQKITNFECINEDGKDDLSPLSTYKDSFGNKLFVYDYGVCRHYMLAIEPIVKHDLSRAIEDIRNITFIHALV